MVLKSLPPAVREAQEQKLEGLKKQQEIHTRLAAERKIFLRDRKIKFFGEFSSLIYCFTIVYLLCVGCNHAATFTQVVVSLFREEENREKNQTSRETAA